MKKVIFIFLFIQFISTVTYTQWSFQQSGVTSALLDIEFINSTTGWICGSDGIILKTTNGGINWINQPNEAAGKYLLGIIPLNENIVYCVGYFETILKTTNGGTNWLTLQNGLIGQGHSYFSVFFLNESTGWIGSTNDVLAKVMKTTNGGLNWDDIIGYGRSNDLYFKDSLNGIGVNDAGYYALTSDGGVNWTYHLLGNGNYNDISVMPYNKNIGFLVSAIGYSIEKTTNFGLTFDSVGFIPNILHELYCSKFINESVGWAGGSYGQLYKTENGGKNWRIQNSLNEAFIWKFYALNDSVVWACGGGGKIIHTTNGGDTITSIQQISSNITDRFELLQNYPNPFNSMTNIKFQMLKPGFAEIIVFDITGKMAKILMKDKLNTGEYEVKFDANDLGSGVYFYTLIVNGKLINTKKAILMK